MGTIRRVTVYEEEGFYVGRFGSDFYGLFFVETPPKELEEYLNWYSSMVVLAQDLSLKWLPQRLPLGQLEDVRCLEDWKDFIGTKLNDKELEELEHRLAWGLGGYWAEVIADWAKLEPRGTSDYIVQVSYTIARLVKNDLYGNSENEEDR